MSLLIICIFAGKLISMDKKQEVKLSKFLSLLLRHNPDAIGLKLDQNGWADVNELIGKSAVKGRKFNLDNLKQVVKNCNKQRYTFNDDYTKIRANQGHSINVDLEFEAQEPPPILYHGTAKHNLNSILKNGIERRNRQYVHLSMDVETATKVGLRHGEVVILKIDTAKMNANGNLFYLSKNNVWLTDFIKPEYISEMDE